MALNRMSGGFQVSYDNAGEYIAGNSQVRVVDIDVDEYDEERVREAVEAAMSLAGLSTSPQKQHKKHRQYVAPRLSKQRGRGRLRFTEVRALYVSFDRFGGGDADPFRALPEFAGGNGHLIHHCELPYFYSFQLLEIGFSCSICLVNNRTHFILIRPQGIRLSLHQM